MTFSEALIVNEEFLLDLIKQTFAEEREKLKEHESEVTTRVAEAQLRIDSHNKSIQDIQT